MKIVCTRETETLKESVWIINNKPDKKTSRKWLGTRIVQNMQCLSSILTSVSIQYTALKSLQDRFQLKRYAAILWTEVRARAFTFWLDPDRLVGKAKIVLWQCSSEQWNIQNRQRDTHLRMLYTVRGVKESVCVCASVCVCKSMRDGFVPPCCTSSPLGFFHFRSPSSPWMVFLMRSRRVVCHWSRREIESNSFTCRQAKGTRRHAFFFIPQITFWRLCSLVLICYTLLVISRGHYTTYSSVFTTSIS